MSTARHSTRTRRNWRLGFVLTILSLLPVTISAPAALATPPRVPAPTPLAKVLAQFRMRSAVTTTSTSRLSPRTYRVRTGDTLSVIARRVYHSRDWQTLWWVNRKLVHNPDAIRRGMLLRLSGWHPASAPAWLVKRADRAAGFGIVQHTVTTAYVAPAPAQSGTAHNPGGFMGCVEQRESGGDPTAYNQSSGASGLFGFLLSTWLSVPASAGYPGGAYTAPVSVQDQAFWQLYNRDGMSPWDADGCPYIY